MTSAKLIATNI